MRDEFDRKAAPDGNDWEAGSLKDVPPNRFER